MMPINLVLSKRARVKCSKRNVYFNYVFYVLCAIKYMAIFAFQNSQNPSTCIYGRIDGFIPRAYRCTASEA